MSGDTQEKNPSGFKYPMKSTIKSLEDKFSEAVCVFSTSRSRAIASRNCHFYLNTEAHLTDWHCEWIGHKSRKERRTIQRWMKMLLDPKISPYKNLVLFIQRDPDFLFDENFFVFSPKRCFENGFSEKYLLNFMITLRAFRENGAVVRQVLRNLPKNTRITILTCVLARHRFSSTAFSHDTFEKRDKTNLLNFVKGRPNERAQYSNQVWGFPQKSSIFTCPLWESKYKPNLVEKESEYAIKYAEIQNKSNTVLVYKYLKEFLS